MTSLDPSKSIMICKYECQLCLQLFKRYGYGGIVIVDRAE